MTTTEQLSRVGQAGLNALQVEMERARRAMAEAMPAALAPLRAFGDGLVRQRQRHEWNRQHALAVKGDQDAVLYLLRTPRP